MPPTRDPTALGSDSALDAPVAIDHETIAQLDSMRDRLAPLLPAIAAELVTSLGAPELRDGVEAWLMAMSRGPGDVALRDCVAVLGRQCAESGVARSRIVQGLGVVRAAHVRQVATEALGTRLAAIIAIDRMFDVALAIWLDAYFLDLELRITRDARALQTLSSGLAHGLRNPLNSAQLQLEVLERRLRRHTPNAAFTEPVGRVQAELVRLGKLVSDLLAYAQPPKLILQHADLNELIGRAAVAERAGADERGVGIAIFGEPVTARVDTYKLGEVIRHLLRNAVEASARDAVVEVTLALEGDQVGIAIADRGAGIRADVLAQIYDPFFSTKPSGTGLGLSIARSLVDLHGGKLRVTTGVDGTRFAISLPRH